MARSGRGENSERTLGENKGIHCRSGVEPFFVSKGLEERNLANFGPSPGKTLNQIPLRERKTPQEGKRRKIETGIGEQWQSECGKGGEETLSGQVGLYQKGKRNGKVVEHPTRAESPLRGRWCGLLKITRRLSGKRSSEDGLGEI